MNLVPHRPFDLFNELQADMNRLFDSRLMPSRSQLLSRSSDWTPAVDIHEDEEAYHVSVDLPGIKPEDIEVTAHNGVLSIKGQREEINEDKDLKRSERVFGEFVREFSMPETADLDNINARTQNGVLQIAIPKSAKAEPKRIEVN